MPTEIRILPVNYVGNTVNLTINGARRDIPVNTIVSVSDEELEVINRANLSYTKGAGLLIPYPPYNELESLKGTLLQEVATVQQQTGAALASFNTAGAEAITSVQQIVEQVEGRAEELFADSLKIPEGIVLSNVVGATPLDRLQNGVTLMQSQRRALLVDEPVTTTEPIITTGFTSIQTVGGGEVYGTGGGEGVIVVKPPVTERASFTSIGVGTWPNSSGQENSTVEGVSDTSQLAVGQVIHLYGNTDRAYSRTTSRLAEQARIIGIAGATVFLNRRLKNPHTSGTIHVLTDEVCRIVGNIHGNTETVRGAAVWLEGVVDPYLDIDVPGNSSAGFLAMSCYRGRYKVGARNLQNNPASSRLGYAAIFYGACYAPTIWIDCEDVRHGYTDGVYSASPPIRSGNVQDAVIEYIKVVSPTAAGIDTHPDSDGLHVKCGIVLSGHNDALQPSRSLLFAVQHRSRNATFENIFTDLPFCINHAPLRQYDSVDRFHNIRQDAKLFGAPSSTNRIIFYQFSNKVIGSGDNPDTPQNGTVVVKGRNCEGGTFRYDSPLTSDTWKNCEFDWSQTNSGWPSSPSGSGLHTFKDCLIRNPVNRQVTMTWDLSGSEILTNGPLVLLDTADVTAIGTTLDTPGTVLGNGGAFAVTSIASGSVKFTYADLRIKSDNPEGAITFFRNLSTGGTVTLKDVSVKRIPTGGTAVRGGASVALTVGTDAKVQRFTSSFSAESAVTLNTAGAVDGDSFYIPRTGQGAFLLDVGPGLRKLRAFEWCHVVFANGAWTLAGYGELNRAQAVLLGTANATVHPVFSPRSLLFAEPITGNRAVTLPANGGTGLQVGDEFFVSRTIEATGAFDVTVAPSGGTTLATLAPGQWARFAYTGTAWTRTASGTA